MATVPRFTFLFALGLVSRLFAGDEVAAALTAKEPPIVLPQMVVVDARDGNPWLYAKAPGIEVLSKLSRSETEAYADGFWRAEQIFAAMIPPEIWGRSRQPIILVLCAGSDTTANADSLRKLDRDQMEEIPLTDSPIDAFAAAQRVLQRRSNPNAEQQLVTYHDDDTTVFFNRRVVPWQSTIYFAAGSQGADLLRGRSLYRDLAARRAPPLPAWLAEGLPAVVAQSHLNTKTDEWGMDELSFWPTSRTSFRPTPQPRLMSLSRIFVNEPPPRTSPDFSLWSYESALFVRWAFGKAALWNFVAGCSRQGASEALFRECFGFGYEGALARITAAFPPLGNQVSLRVRSLGPKPNLNFDVADDLTIRRVVAELERLESDYLRPRYPTVATEYLNSALATLAKNKGGAEKDPEFMAVWGLCALAAGDKRKAQACLEAIGPAPGVSRPVVYLTLARLRYEAALRRVADTHARLTNAETKAVLDPLLQAFSLPPPQPEEFRLLLDLAEHGSLTFDAKSRAALESATKLFPADADLTRRIEQALAPTTVPR